MSSAFELYCKKPLSQSVRTIQGKSRLHLRTYSVHTVFSTLQPSNAEVLLLHRAPEGLADSSGTRYTRHTTSQRGPYSHSQTNIERVKIIENRVVDEKNHNHKDEVQQLNVVHGARSSAAEVR